MATLSAVLPRPASRSRAVGVWLLIVAALIAAMVTVGGLTRLTGSGLSITEWHPLTGVVPPLDQQSWASEFQKYQRIPQYRLEHPAMSLSDFKAIYWWEWSHRFLARLVGAAFLLPFLYFAVATAIPRADFPRMLGLFVLGGLQGFVGWWMVESGLETRVSVSQYRLAIHLGVAIILLGAILWTALDYLSADGSRRATKLQTPNLPPLWGKVARVPAQAGTSATERGHSEFPPSASTGLHPVSAPSPTRGGGLNLLSNFALAFVALVYVQMLLGALVAGLHAGLIYNTWPSMNGRAFPETPFFNHPWWVNFGDNPGLAQFDHRLGAYAVAFGAFALWWVGRRSAHETRLSANVLLGITAFQIALGIITLLTQAPLPMAALHQATAVALFAAAVWHAHALSLTPGRAPVPGRQ